MRKNKNKKSHENDRHTYVFLVGVSLVRTFGCSLGAVAEGGFEMNWRVASAVQAASALRCVTGLLVVVCVRTIVIVVQVEIIIIAKGAVESGVQIVIVVKRVIALWVTRRVQSIVTCCRKKEFGGMNEQKLVTCEMPNFKW